MTVDVTFAHPWGPPHSETSYAVGQRASLDEDTVRRLIEAGIVVPATKTAAKEVGADPESAATAKK